MKTPNRLIGSGFICILESFAAILHKMLPLFSCLHVICGSTIQSPATFSRVLTSFVAPLPRVLPLFFMSSRTLWHHYPECCHFFSCAYFICGAITPSAATFSREFTSFVAPLPRVLPLFLVSLPHLWHHYPECCHFSSYFHFVCGSTIQSPATNEVSLPHLWHHYPKCCHFSSCLPFVCGSTTFSVRSFCSNLFSK